MNHLVSRRNVIVVIVLVSLGLWLFLDDRTGTPTVTVRTDIGTVTSFVSVSGEATVEETIPLSFPRGGTVSGVFVKKGDEVEAGTILATIGDTSQQAEYSGALAEVARTRALRDEIANGQTAEQRAVTDAIVARAEQAVTNTIKTEMARVEAARTALFSTGLTAIPDNTDHAAPPPIITGSYLCTAEGTYTIEPYRSGSLSGFSYRYSGIETGTENASTEQAGSLGDCGLRLQFADGANYTNVTYTITIPNTNSSSYASNRATYDQALATEAANIAAAQAALTLATSEATSATAGARVESLIAANASVAAAEARLLQIAALVSDTAIRAPRSGVITDVSIVVGQTVTATPVITLFHPSRVTFTARIPEKDIPRIHPEQSAKLQFDAAPDTSISGTVAFVSPTQTTISGVTYYEAEIILADSPTWLRTGMQADVQIYTETLTDVVRVPRLYIYDNQVFLRSGETVTPTKVDVLLVGSDGFVAIAGVPAGTEVILPTK